MTARRPIPDRSADEVAALWDELGTRPLFFAIRSGRRDIPVSVALKDGAHVIGVAGHDPFQDFALLARLLIEGRRLTRDGYMRWAGSVARDAAVWRAVKRQERTCATFGYRDAWDEYQHVTGRKKRPPVDATVFDRIEAERKGKP